jgi:hypothetical protein
MKFLIGIISGIALAGAGVTVASSNPFDAAAATVTPEVAYVQPSVAHTLTAAKPVQRFTGELSHKDTGAFELKITVRQNGVLVDRDVRVLVARAKVTNRAGQRVRLPLDDATARVTGAMLPRSAWRLDDDGQVIATFAASRVLVIATTPRDQADQAEGQASQSAQDAVDTQESTAD